METLNIKSVPNKTWQQIQRELEKKNALHELLISEIRINRIKKEKIV